MGWVLGGSWVLWGALRTLLGAPQAWSHAGGAQRGSVLRWLGAGGLSPTLVRLCCGAPAQPQRVPGGGLTHPGLPWDFQPFGCSNCSLKTNYIFFPGWGYVSWGGWGGRAPGWQHPCPPAWRDAPCPVSRPPTGSPTSWGATGEGAPTVPVPATGGHLHTGAGVATPLPATPGPLHAPWVPPQPPALVGDSGIPQAMLAPRKRILLKMPLG